MTKFIIPKLGAGFVQRKGTWKNGHITGYGTLVHVNGDRYTGGFEGGQRNGEGTMVSTETG